jgi:hypothetical protein
MRRIGEAEERVRKLEGLLLKLCQAIVDDNTMQDSPVWDAALFVKFEISE